MKSLFRPFPMPLTGKQWFYLGILQGVGAGFVDGGLNFLIAWAMYHSQDRVTLWVFKHNTIAGDLGVTPLIQCGVSMVITSTLVHTDLHHKQIKPLPFVYPHVESLPDPRSLFEPKVAAEALEKQARVDETVEKAESINQNRGFFSYYFWMLIRFIFEGTEKNILLVRIPVKEWFGRLAWTVLQGLGIGVIFGFPLWCLAIVILGPIYRLDNLGSVWAPQVIKLVYAAILGWLTNPVIATLALGSQAEHHLVVVETDSETASTADEAGQSEPRGAVETIAEEGEVIESPRAPLSPTLTMRRPPPSPQRSTRLGIPTAGTPGDRRSRANSAASNGSSTRPPLTADVSYFRQPGTPMSTHSPAGANLLAPPNTAATLGAASSSTGRPRGATVSSERSFSYALGGTGGRAKRTRSNRSESVGGGPMLPTFNLPKRSEAGDFNEMGERLRWNDGDRDVFGSLPSSTSNPVMGNERGTGSLGPQFVRSRTDF